MSRSDFTASANVRVVVEVQGMGPYGEDWKTCHQQGQAGIRSLCIMRQTKSARTIPDHRRTDG